LVTVGSETGGQRELRLEAESDEAVMASVGALLEPGELVLGFIRDPEPGVDPDEWAGAL
jgi:hypothetical protein